MALVGKGKTGRSGGEVDKGLKLLDEATAAAVAGELRPYATGLVYCCTISSCQELGDYRRAAEWTEAANRWCDASRSSGMPGECRVHRAQIMRFRGDWPEAEEQAVAACEELQDYNRFVTSAGFYEIGEIRRRRGDFAAAEEAYRQANELGHDPQPGLALLRLAEGKVDGAVAGNHARLAELEDPLSRLQQLPAQVEIAHRRRRREDGPRGRGRARDASSTRTRSAAGRAPASTRRSTSRRARSQLAEGDWKEPPGACGARATSGRQVGAPYETAHARMLLGIAFGVEGDEDGATAEFEAALATFERLGAQARRGAREGAARQARDAPHVPLHGHRRIDEAARARWATRSGRSCSPTQRAGSRADRRERR